MNLSIFTGLFGGVGLFLLGMRLLTDGLKLYAGSSLRNILKASTRTPLLGILSGAFLTSIVQSSSAVTVATIGFVNAGLMGIGHAVTLVYGSNLGTTMTGWLVSLIGFQVNIQAFALPAIGLGMLLRIVSRDGRYAALGDVLAGFGIFFMGIDVLKMSLGTLGETFQFAGLAGKGIFSLLLFCGIGFLLTCLMQSSSASIALILTAVAGGVISFQDAAAVVIGANVGTTSTAALAVIGATSNAKRLAAAHVIFNLITGLVALLILPVLLNFLDIIRPFVNQTNPETTLLALFHTIFNLLGVIILYPLTKKLVRFLKKRFRTAEEDEARPRYLDRTVVATPILALHALDMELTRMAQISNRMSKAAISIESGPTARLTSDKAIIDKLVLEVGNFGKKMQQTTLPAALSEKLPDAMRISGYLFDIGELTEGLARLQPPQQRMEEMPLASELASFKSRVVHFIDQLGDDGKEFNGKTFIQELEEIKEDYRTLKAKFLRAAGKGDMSAGQMVSYLEIIAHIRRIAEQSEKSFRYLNAIKQTEEILSQKNEETEHKE
ncbi:MAG: Na/Pi symporter [Desulfobulbaceae bacterium]|nr:Na/Pi symporter [Desulfobulbaceae bacterium]